MTTLLKYIILSLFSLGTVLILAPVCTADVVVIDRVTTVQTPVRLTVLTKGRFFAAGGRRVDVSVDDKHLKRILTGGDGYGYLKYTPRSTGYKTIKARSGADSAKGLLMVVTKKDRVLVIEVEEGFKTAVFSDEIKQSSLKVVKALSKTYKIIYLSRFAGKSLTGAWLEKQGFPRSVILVWRGPDTLTELKKKGVPLHAVIGSPPIVTAVVDEIEKRFTFGKTKDGTTVKDWDEIAKLLKY
jgi:hypothetical protein